MGITTHHSEDGEEVTVSVAGRFDYRFYDSFKASISSIEGSHLVHVDLSQADYIDSSALGMLLILREKVGKVAEILLVDPSPDVARILSIANFDKLFAIKQ